MRQRQTETERDRQTERQRPRQSDRQRQRDRDTETDRETEHISHLRKLTNKLGERGWGVVKCASSRGFKQNDINAVAD